MSGGAQAKQRRSITAKELAKRLGSSERTARRLIAEPREEFLERAEARRKQVVGLREEGMKYREIAEELGISTGAVGRILHDARKLEGAETPGRGVRGFHGSGLPGVRVSTRPQQTASEAGP